MFLLLDLETGGLTHDHSILTMYMAILDGNLHIKNELGLSLKPDNGPIVADEEALKVNGISLNEHIINAIPESEAAAKIADFISKYSNDGKSKLMPLGHNPNFDIKFIQAKLVNKKDWDKNCQEPMDTIVLGKFLKILGKLPQDLPNSLGSYAEYFGILTPGLHDAKIDCETTVSVLKKMIRLVNEGKI